MSAWIASLPVTSARFLPWKWQFWLDRRWQLSSLMSAAVWILGTLAIIQAKEMIRGWIAIILVGLFLDFVMWSAGKAWIFAGCGVDAEVSAGRNIVVWAVFFVVNVTLTWALTHPADASTMQARYMLVAYGVLINPVRFRINKEVVFGEHSLQSTAKRVKSSLKKKTTA